MKRELNQEDFAAEAENERRLMGMLVSSMLSAAFVSALLLGALKVWG